MNNKDKKGEVAEFNMDALNEAVNTNGQAMSEGLRVEDDSTLVLKGKDGSYLLSRPGADGLTPLDQPKVVQFLNKFRTTRGIPFDNGIQLAQCLGIKEYGEITPNTELYFNAIRGRPEIGWYTHRRRSETTEFTDRKDVLASLRSPIAIRGRSYR